MTSNTSHSSIDRRDLIKVLGASSGALVAAAFLPERWVKPSVNAGVLPAHAQASCGIVGFLGWWNCTYFDVPCILDLPDMGGFEYWPSSYTPQSVQVRACGNPINSQLFPSSPLFPSTFVIAINREDLNGCPTVEVTVTFRGGCPASIVVDAPPPLPG